jgi:hypothetical protein
MENEKNELTHKTPYSKKYVSKELIGYGSNGNRVYKVLNTFDNKVILLINST